MKRSDLRSFGAAAALLCLSSIAQADQCVTSTGKYQGKSVTAETCTARVEEVFNASSDGFRYTAYGVTFAGQRVVVPDTLNLSQHAIGDEISFVVSKFASSGKSERVGVKSLSFEILEFRPSTKDEKVKAK